MYEKYARDVYRYALAVLQNPADAEDVTQTTFLNAYRSYAGGARPQKPKHWLITIAHNVCRQRFRQSLRRPHEVKLQEEIAEAAVPDEQYSVEDIRRGLSQLSFNQRSALVMRELEDRSYADIAEILGLSISAVETLLFRARRALREQLEGTLTCHEAELALSKQVDRRLARAEKSQLRAHLRGCAACSTFARSQRAQKSAWKALGAIPLPSSLSSLFGGGSAAVGTGVAVKAAAVTFAGFAVVGGTYELAGKDVFLGSTDSAQVAKLQRSATPSRAGERGAPTLRVVDNRGVEGPAAAVVVVHRPKGQASAGGAAKPHAARRVPPAHPAKPVAPTAAATPTGVSQTPVVSEPEGVDTATPTTSHSGKSGNHRGDEHGAGAGNATSSRGSAQAKKKGSAGQARGHDKQDAKGGSGSEAHGSSGSNGAKGEKDKGQKPDHGKAPEEKPDHGNSTPSAVPGGEDAPSAVPIEETPAESPQGEGSQKPDKPDKPDKEKPEKPGKSDAVSLGLSII
jgi:RNA polymerase sigma factor (sigma-70 family)